ncbi:GntR family transcriptional regulator [Thermomonospora umbrina]|uniref:Regulatory GntR family protein n=1 Tax=Thermomonospora umbrina TaxID=111806 RepID=A0A3D9STQ4_9ACTN|nr:GntR family transcriptional regulator [Thermomonospora umbrina]REE97870.1 regulatory GntR family protein [Thermomonospora umbrina]
MGAVTRSTVVDEIADKIAFQIASGRLEAGESLPSIRRMAEEYEINPSTVQLALERLRMAGFVEPRRGVGIVVRDIEMYGGVEIWHYLLRFSSRLPDLTVRTVQEILETLRMFYESSWAKIAADPSAYDPRPVRRALQRLELLAATEDAAPAEVYKCVLHVLRTSSAALGRTVMLSVLNSLGGVMGEVPEVVDALYCRPAEHAWWWGQVVTAWETADTELAASTLALLDDWHAEALGRLRVLLNAAVS